ncbi:MAG: Phosphatidylglycerophosphatase A [Turneriella sp.]|nr:Phosphatidylglycerophosphatase A [Turneriella sp.]
MAKKRIAKSKHATTTKPLRKKIDETPQETPTSYISPLAAQRLPVFTWYEFIATGFFSGYLPKAPGTWGSLCAAFLFYLVAQFIPLEGRWTLGAFSFSYLAFALGIATTFIGIYTSEKLANEWREKDPGEIVIDEFAGIFIACLFVAPTILGILIAFTFFRLFDILKPGPIASLQNLPGGRGIVLDDVLAGAIAGACAFLVSWPLKSYIS